MQSALIIGLPAARREARRLALPLIAANLSVPLLGMVDTAVVGHLPDAADLTAAALASYLVSTVWFLFGFLRTGTTALSAQAVGAGDPALIEATLVRAVVTSIGIGTILLFAAWPLQALAHLLFQPQGRVADGLDAFLAVRLLGAPAALGQFAVTGWLLGRQQSKGPLVVALVANILNGLLDVWFVFGLGLGLASVAAATTISEYAGFAVALLMAARTAIPTRPAIRMALRDRAALGRLFVVNRDLFLRSLFLEASFIVFAVLAARLGQGFVAANAILMTFFTAAAWLLDGFAQACETMVGKAAGARSVASMRSVIRASFEHALLLALVLTAGFAAGGGMLVNLMTSHEAVRSIALVHLPFIVAIPIVSVWAFVYDGIFFGTARGDILRNAMAVTLVLFVLMSAALVPLLGSFGLWWAFLAFLGARGIVLGWAFGRIGGSRHLAGLSELV